MIINGMSEFLPADDFELDGEHYTVMVDEGRFYFVQESTHRSKSIAMGQERREMFGEAYEAIPNNSEGTAAH